MITFITYDPTVPILNTFPTEMYTYKNVHSSIISNSPKLETIQIRINSIISKVWYIHALEYYTAILNITQVNLTNIISRKTSYHKSTLYNSNEQAQII